MSKVTRRPGVGGGFAVIYEASLVNMTKEGPPVTVNWAVGVSDPRLSYVGGTFF